MIVPSIGKSALLQLPLSGIVKWRYNAKLSHITLRLMNEDLEEFKRIVENFFECRDSLVDMGFSGFRLSERELICSHPRGIGSLRLRCVLRDRNVVFEVDGEGEIPSAVRTMMGYDFG
jgi:hypothetical protein